MRVVLDFETYYDDDYSLKKMPVLEYIRDERFQAHGAAVKVDQQATKWLPGAALKSFLDQLPENVELVCQNCYFDGLILFEHYQYVPGTYADTLSMARALLPWLPNHDLDSLAKALQLGEKIPEVLGLTKGIRKLPPELMQQLGEYAINDVDLTVALYEKLRPGLPDTESKLIDLTMRWACRPTLLVDLPRLLRAYREALRTRRDLIQGSSTTIDVLSSQPKFRDYLEALGVVVPQKKNKKGVLIPALGKDDLGFRQMIADYPEHSALFAGRLAAKSTLTHTRIRRIYKIGVNGTLPMPLKFYGAHTGRWSGLDGINVQNFTRGSELRKSIIAPAGYVILVADLKQIEARLNMWFCCEAYWLSVFAAGKDIYTATAAGHFGVAYEDVTPAQRRFGKTLELGLGYGMGWRKFRVQSALKRTFLTEQQAYEAVTKYRNRHPALVAMWRVLNNMLYGMYQEGFSRDIHPVTFTHEAILLPNGMRLDYSGLAPTEDGDWFYGVGRHKKIYGGAILENIIQALARIIIGEHLLAIEALPGVTTVGSVHDEGLALVRVEEADAAVKAVTRIMTTPPVWAPDLPLGVDIGQSREYSK